MVLFDANFFSVALHPDAKPKLDKVEGRERIDILLERLQKEQERIVIPTPVLAEFLVLAKNDAPKYLEEIRKNSVFRIYSFDQAAAIELSAIEIVARDAGDKRGPTPDSAWQKVKFDRQIVAIAKVRQCDAIYTDDEGLAAHAAKAGIAVIRTDDLPQPVQPKLFNESDIGSAKSEFEASERPEAREVTVKKAGLIPDQASKENGISSQEQTDKKEDQIKIRIELPGKEAAEAVKPPHATIPVFVINDKVNQGDAKPADPPAKHEKQ